jgi:hypothetical protein
MAIPRSSWKTIRNGTWIVARFVLFGVGGFLGMSVGGFYLIGRVLDASGNRDYISPFLSLPLTLLGAVMMLFGVGEWGRWAHLWVFLSIPLSLCALWLLPPSAGSGKELGVMVPAVALVGSYAIVRRYYRYRDAPKSHGTEDSAPALPSRDQEPK